MLKDKMTARTGKVGPDSHGRTTRDETVEIKTVGTGQPRQDSRDRTGQPKQASPDRTAMTEQPRWDSCDGIAWLSQPGQDRTRQSRQDMYWAQGADVQLVSTLPGSVWNHVKSESCAHCQGHFKFSWIAALRGDVPKEHHENSTVATPEPWCWTKWVRICHWPS